MCDGLNDGETVGEYVSPYFKGGFVGCDVDNVGVFDGKFVGDTVGSVEGVFVGNFEGSVVGVYNGD